MTLCSNIFSEMAIDGCPSDRIIQPKTTPQSLQYALKKWYFRFTGYDDFWLVNRYENGNITVEVSDADQYVKVFLGNALVSTSCEKAYSIILKNQHLWRRKI